jgi:hypothetical protein
MYLEEGGGVWERSVGSRYGPMASGCCVQKNAQFSTSHLMLIDASSGEDIVLLTKIY